MKALYWICRYLSAGGAIFLVANLPDPLNMETGVFLGVMIVFAFLTEKMEVDKC